MPDMPNYKEFGGAGQKSQKDATDIYDSRYGKYDDKVVKDDKVSKQPPAQPKPLSIRGS